MKVNSVRFGRLDVPADKLIVMERPILGFESLTKFCLIEIDELKPLLWYQSVEEPAVAFLVVNPLMIVPDYRIEINSNEIAELKVTRPEKVETYVIVTISEELADLSVNLQGPILINSENNLAKQLVLVNSNYSVNHRIGAELVTDEATSGTGAKKRKEEELVPA